MDSAGSCAESRRPRMMPLARNCRRSCVARMELRSRLEQEDGEDEVAINIQASHWHWGWREGKDAAPRGPGNKKLNCQKSTSAVALGAIGGCAASRGPAVPAGLVTSSITASAAQLPCDVARYFAGWYRDECWGRQIGTVHVREYLASWCGTTRFPGCGYRQQSHQLYTA